MKLELGLRSGCRCEHHARGNVQQPEHPPRTYYFLLPLSSLAWVWEVLHSLFSYFESTRKDYPILSESSWIVVLWGIEARSTIWLEMKPEQQLVKQLVCRWSLIHGDVWRRPPSTGLACPCVISSLWEGLWVLRRREGGLWRSRLGGGEQKRPDSGLFVKDTVLLLIHACPQSLL